MWVSLDMFMEIRQSIFYKNMYVQATLKFKLTFKKYINLLIVYSYDFISINKKLPIVIAQ